MTIITQDYVLSTRDELPLVVQRQALETFEYSLGSAIHASYLLGSVKALNHLAIRTLFPEHSENLHPLLLAKQIQAGISEESIRKEGQLRRIYQLGRSAITVRCVPDFQKQLDELHFIFSGAYRSDVAPAVMAIEGIVTEANKLNSNALEWYKQ
ncbi:Uncharacterised protein [uncultured archaeon]|nr:Uncharacterised protein [uncultured archaeon]